MTKLTKEWEKKLAYFEHEGSKVYLRRQAPFKVRLKRAINKLEAQCRAVEDAVDRLARRDEQLFSKVTEAYSTNDTNRANVYAGELVELRKTIDFIMNHKLVLEKMALQLGTIHHLGGAAVTLVPAIETLQDVRTGIKGFFPDMDMELGSITDMLSQVVVESGKSARASSASFLSEATSENAIGILREAALVAEQEKDVQIPNVPMPERPTNSRPSRETDMEA